MEMSVLNNPRQSSRPVRPNSTAPWSESSTSAEYSNNALLPQLYEGWNFDPNQIQADNWGTVARRLIAQSSKKVEQIPFESLVELARRGTSPNLGGVLDEYESIYTQMCSFYVGPPKNIKHREHLRLMKERLEEEEAGSDPFIRTVINDAYESVVNETTRQSDLIALLRHFITDPLSGQLHESVPRETMLRRKKVLALRLRRYLSGSGNKWDKPFDANTTLLDSFFSLGPEALAVSLTNIDHDLYRKLDIHSFKNGGQALQTLKNRENDLTWSVRECLETRLLSENQLFELAQHLRDISNYLSMEAVRNGVIFAQPSPEIKQQLQDLVNLEQQLNLAKPGLYPLSRGAMRPDLSKNPQLAEKYIDLCVCYTIERSGLVGTWGERSKSMMFTDTMIVGKNDSQFSLGSTLVNTASFGMEYCPVSPETVGDADGVLDRPGVWGLHIRGWLCCFES